MSDREWISRRDGTPAPEDYPVSVLRVGCPNDQSPGPFTVYDANNFDDLVTHWCSFPTFPEEYLYYGP